MTFLPNPFEGGYTVLPIQVFQWAGRPQADFQGIAAAADHRHPRLMLILQRGSPSCVRARLSRHIQW